MLSILKYLLVILYIVDGYNSSNFLSLQKPKSNMLLRSSNNNDFSTYNTSTFLSLQKPKSNILLRKSNNDYNPFLINGNIIKKIYVNFDKSRAIVIYSDNLIKHCSNKSSILNNLIYNKENKDISIVSNKYMNILNGTIY